MDDLAELQIILQATNNSTIHVQINVRLETWSSVVGVGDFCTVIAKGEDCLFSFRETCALALTITLILKPVLNFLVWLKISEGQICCKQNNSFFVPSLALVIVLDFIGYF